MAKTYITGDLDFAALKSKFYGLEVKAAMETQEFCRQMAVRALNVVLKWTPPNRNTNASQRPGIEGIKDLRARISRDLWNDQTPLTTTPRKTKSGRVVPGKLTGWRGAGGFPFVIAAGGVAPRKQLTDPGEVIRKHGQWKQKKGVVHMTYAGPKKTVFWVTAAALKREIRRRQKHAGELISGWYPAAKALHLSSLASYSPAGHSQAGGYKFMSFPPRASGLPSADWALDVRNSVPSSPIVSPWVQSEIATSLDRRIALAQSGLYLTRLKALGQKLNFAA